MVTTNQNPVIDMQKNKEKKTTTISLKEANVSWEKRAREESNRTTNTTQNG